MTTNRRSSLLAIAVVLALAVIPQVTLAAALPPGVSAEDSKQFMPVSQLKRGMRGYGLTVFHGTKIEKFDVEILGVMKQMNTGKDLVLVRVGGGPITKRDTGIIAGMSGSPCYVNGKLVGAISYGSGFAKEPVGMVTPIADMLEAWDENLPKRPSGHSSVDLAEPVKVGGKDVRRIEITKPGEGERGVSDGVLHMEPLMMPLMVSGVSTRGIGRLAEILRPYGIEPTAGPGGAGKKGVSASLEPGAAVGVSLARGDIDISAVGTLTYRRGDKIVAFGHPMLGIGAIDAPLTTAYVDDVLSSYRTSTKMASPLKTVGRVFQDRPWSVAGTVGPMPRTIPATITIDDQAFGRRRTFKVSVINHPQLASRILTMVVGEAIFDTHPTPGDATAEVSYEVNADQIGKVKRSNVFFDPAAIESAAITDVGSLLEILSGNRFYPLDVKSVNVNVRIVGRRNTASIDRIFVKESEFEPGENVEVGVVLRPYKQDRVTKTFTVKIPATAADGKMVLAVRGGAQPAMVPMIIPTASGDEDGGAPVMPILPSGSSLASADNVKQLVDKYLEREKNNEVVVQLLMRSTAMNVSGEKLTGLPSSIADVMKSSKNSGLKMEREEVKQTFGADYIVFGGAQLQINVKRKDLKESKSPPKLAPPMTESVGDDPGSPSPVMSFDLDDSDYASRAALSAPADGRQPVDSLLGPDSEDEDEETPAKDEDTPAVAPDKKPSGTPTPPATAGPAAAPKTDVKTVVRQGKTWTQRTQADFAKGTFSGVAASSENRLELTPTLKKLVETPEQFVWCLAPAEGGVYAGTGNSGKIYHIQDNGEIKVFYETGELEVHALAVDSKGNLYAGTSPHGKVFKISPDGKGEVVFKASEKYVVALALDGEDNLYAGVGDSGKVYKIAPGSDGQLFVEINEQQILSLCWDPKGSLLAGTGINGVVYRVDKSGRAEPIFDAAEDSVTAVVTDGQGNVYAGTSPKGGVYKISPDGRSKALYSKATRVLSMVCDAKNNVYAVSDGNLVQIHPDETVIHLDSAQDKVQFLALVMNQKTGGLYAGTGNIGSVYISKCCDAMGQFESAVHDAGMVSRWGRVKWTAVTPEGTSVELQTRTGNVATPDATWSGWSQAYTSGGGEQIAGAPGRYIQYRVTLKTSGEVSPEVSSVTISYLTPNQKPKVALTAPTGSDVWAGKETIRWTGSDPDKDTLTYDVYYSKDGKDWKALAGGVSAPTNGATGSKKTDEEITAKVKAELEKSREVPEEMKKQILKSMPNETKPEGPPAPAEAASSKTTYSWDTSKVEDGRYTVKVVASDRTSNAQDPLNDEAVSEPVTVCNTPPKIDMRPRSLTVKGVGSATIKGSASSKLVEVVGVQYRVDGGAWLAASTEDGMFDSSSEEFSITTESLQAGTHKVEVQAIDAAGNASSETVEVKVSAVGGTGG